MRDSISTDLPVSIAASADVTSTSRIAFCAGFYFSARMVIVLFSARVLGLEPRIGSAVSISLNLLLLVLVCFHSLGSKVRSFSSLLHLSTVRWVVLYLAFAGCSFAWTLAISPSASFAYWCGLTADVLIVLVLLSGGATTMVSHSLLSGFIWATCMLAVIALVMPAQSDLRLGDPDFFNTNQIGDLCALSILFVQLLMRRIEGKWGLITLFLLFTLVRSLSKTTLAAFFVCEAFLVIRDRSMSRRSKTMITGGAALLVLAFWGLFEAYYSVYTNAGNQVETLTGRTAIWAYALDAGFSKPWFGNGFDSMWKVVPPFGNEMFEARHAENEVLQQFYAYGVCGLVMLIGIYGSLWRRIRQLQRSPVRVIYISILLYELVRGLAEANTFDLLLPLWAVVLLAALVDDEMRTEREKALSTRDSPAPLSGPQPPQ
jgi:exopolysaccharide production protein ExoQ